MEINKIGDAPKGHVVVQIVIGKHVLTTRTITASDYNRALEHLREHEAKPN